MKKLLIIVVIGILASCSGNDSTEEVREKIAGKKKEMRQLKDEIRALEEKLAKMDTARFDSSNLTPVEIEVVNPNPFNHYIEVNGTVNAVEEAYISAEMNGQIDKIHVDEGQNVYKGQLLISLNTDVTRSSIEEVKTNLELQEKLYQKQKELWEQKIGSELDYLQAKNRY
jgi:multidrug efflux pump subunit AcrA (membrane-fusion protein)